jgi:hypothetical protein
MAAAFLGLWLIPGATTTVLPFLLLFGATYFFAEFAPNTTTLVYPAEIFPVRVRTTSYGITAAAGKIGVFHRHLCPGGAAASDWPGPDQRHRRWVALLGLLLTLTMLPEPKGTNLENFTEPRRASSQAALGLSEEPRHPGAQRLTALTGARPAVNGEPGCRVRTAEGTVTGAVYRFVVDDDAADARSSASTPACGRISWAAMMPCTGASNGSRLSSSK